MRGAFALTPLALTVTGRVQRASPSDAAAFLEAAFGLCLGCKIFAVLMRAGVISEEACERCRDVRREH